MKIVIDRHIPYIQGILESYAEVVYLPGNAIDAQQLRDADALLIRTRTKVNATLLDGTPVRFIGTATIGTDHIDVDYCSQRGITVANAAGCNAAAVMQYMVAALLTLSERQKRPLNGMALGIVGVGNVGKLVAKSAQVLGMNVLLNDPPRAAREGAAGFTGLDELLKNSDAVTLHVPLAADTYEMANADFFSKMKPGAWFFNASRGEVADEKALIASRKKLGAIVIDVWQHEPLVNESLLPLADIATPHIAGYSVQGKMNATRMIVQAAARFFGWKALFDFVPEATTEPLELKLGSQDNLFSGLQKSYEIMKDDHNLRRQPAHFEQLRTAYEFRNDFSGYNVHVSKNTALATVLKELGCRVIKEDENYII